MKKIAILITIWVFGLSLNSYAHDNAKDSLAVKKSYFQSAKKEIESMLDGKEPLSYERAIFLMENAYWENSISYQQYQSVLNNHTRNILRIAKQNLDELTDDYNPKFVYDAARQNHDQYKKAKKKLYLNWAIFKYMTDAPTYVSDNDTLKLTHPYRFKYSYKDPLGTKDWSNTQVINLLQNHRGNCFALASLYKIFADRLQTDAILCTAPGHIYISHENEKGVPFNVELSNASFPGCGTLETLTYTTNEATINNIALRNLTLKQSIALCLVYLAEGYQYKFSTKDDAFMLQCAEDALKYDDHNLNAMLLKAEILESRILAQNETFVNLQSEGEFKKYENLIAHLYKLGYREMPLSMKNLLIKGWTKDSATYVIVKNNLPPKYNHSGVTNTRYASLSWGLFDEEIPNKPIERFGRTIFDTKKKKIVKFDNAEVLYNDYNFDPVAFAWNVDPMAYKFPGQSPYAAFDNSPIWKSDPTGASGEIVIDKQSRIATVQMNMILYGTKATQAIATSTARDIQNAYNAANATVTIGGQAYKVQFEVKGEYINSGNGLDVMQEARTANAILSNGDIKNNYYRVENTTPDGTSFTTLNGGNTGMFELSQIAPDNSTTEAHEAGHGLGLQHNSSSAYEDVINGKPDIMDLQGDKVQGKYRAAYALPNGSLDVSKRQVSQKNINDIFTPAVKQQLQNNGKADVGKTTDTYYTPDGTPVSK